jgi:hypothetical protein
MANPRAVKAGRAYIELATSDKALVRGLAKASARLKAFGASAARIGAGMVAASGAVAAPLVASVKSFMTLGDQLQKMAQRTGIAVEALSELKFAAERSGASVGVVEKAVKAMSKRVLDFERGLSTNVRTFDELGLSVKDLKGLKPEEQFTLISDRLSKVADESRRAALAQEVFGRAGTALLPMIKDGAAGMDALRNKAKELGVVMTQTDADAAAELTDTMGDLWTTLQAVAVQIGAALAPAIIEFAESVREVLKDMVEWVRQNRESTVWYAKVVVAVAAVGTALVAIGSAAGLAGVALGGVAKVIGMVSIASKAAVPAVTSLSGAMGLLNKAALAVAVAFAGWEIGKLIADATGLTDAIHDMSKALDLFGENTALKKQAENMKEMEQILKERRAAQAKARGEKPTTPEHEFDPERDAVRPGLHDQFTAEEIARFENPEIEEKSYQAHIGGLIGDAIKGVFTKARDAIVKDINDSVEIRKLGGFDEPPPEDRIDGMSDVPDGLKDRLDALDNADEGVKQAEAVVSSKGLFNVAALQGLLGGGPDDRVAKATEATAKNTARIEKAVRESAPAFS